MKLPNGYGSVAKLTGNRRRPYMVRITIGFTDDGRHTCASLLDDKDVNVKIKKLILGHASSDVTERVYTHKTLEQLLEAINLI